MGDNPGNPYRPHATSKQRGIRAARTAVRSCTGCGADTDTPDTTGPKEAAHAPLHHDRRRLALARGIRAVLDFRRIQRGAPNRLLPPAPAPAHHRLWRSPQRKLPHGYLRACPPSFKTRCCCAALDPPLRAATRTPSAEPISRAVISHVGPMHTSHAPAAAAPCRTRSASSATKVFLSPSSGAAWPLARPDARRGTLEPSGVHEDESLHVSRRQAQARVIQRLGAGSRPRRLRMASRGHVARLSFGPKRAHGNADLGLVHLCGR